MPNKVHHPKGMRNKIYAPCNYQSLLNRKIEPLKITKKKPEYLIRNEDGKKYGIELK